MRDSKSIADCQLPIADFVPAWSAWFYVNSYLSESGCTKPACNVSLPPNRQSAIGNWQLLEERNANIRTDSKGMSLDENCPDCHSPSNLSFSYISFTIAGADELALYSASSLLSFAVALHWPPPRRSSPGSERRSGSTKHFLFRRSRRR